jgi:AraC family transcriptional regulator
MKQAIQKPFGKHILKDHRIAGFTLFEALYPPKLQQPRHTHPLASFSFVLAGSYLERYGREAQTRQPSTITFHPPQESHAVDFHDEVRIFSIQIDFQRLAYIRERSVVLDASASCRSETVAWLGRRIYQEFRRMDSASALAIEGCIFEILAEASRSKVTTSERQSPLWLEQVKEFLHGNFSESFIFEDVAKVAGVHPVHLARVFRERNGCTIGEYVRRLRVEFACRQITATEIPLSEIALAAGFADHSHLTKSFKAHFGLTPSEYRKLSRQR